MTDYPPLVDPARFEAVKLPKDVDVQVLTLHLRFIKAYVDQVSKDLAKLQVESKEKQLVASEPGDMVVQSGPHADEDQAAEPLPSAPVTVETGPKRATWYLVYVGNTIGPVLGGERATLAVGGVKNAYKEECASEEQALERFHEALCANNATIFREIPAVRHAIRWEDYYPNTPRPEKYMRNND